MFVNVKFDDKEIVLITKNIEDIQSEFLKKEYKKIRLEIRKKDNHIDFFKEMLVEEITIKEIEWTKENLNNEMRYLKGCN